MELDTLIQFDAPVAEMETLEEWRDIVTLDKTAVAEMVAKLKDEEPEFPVIRVEEGWSRNGRLWTGDILRNIAEQITTTQPVGHLGHIDPAQKSTALPDPQTVWLGATTKQEPSLLKERKGEIVTVLYAKGYNLPNAKIRGYLKAKAVNSTSWDGMAALKKIPDRGVEVVKFILNSIDWSRKNTAGMSAQFMGLAAEMHNEDDNDEGGKTVEIDWSKVTVEEIKTQNPSLYTVLVAEMAAEKDAELEQLQEQVDEAKADIDLVAKLREAVGADADADLLAVVGALMEKSKAIVKGTLDKHLQAILMKKVPNETTRKAVMALLPAAEMEAKLPTDKTDDETEEIVSEMVDEAFDASEIIQGLVSEMGNGHNVGSSARRRELGDGKQQQLVGVSETHRAIG